MIEGSIEKHTIIKVNFTSNANFVQQTKNIFNSFDFQTHNYLISQGDDLNIFFSSLRDNILNKISAFEKKDSGWSLKQVKCLDKNVNKFNPLRGTSYIDLPQDIKAKKLLSMLNIPIIYVLNGHYSQRYTLSIKTQIAHHLTSCIPINLNSTVYLSQLN